MKNNSIESDLMAYINDKINSELVEDFNLDSDGFNNNTLIVDFLWKTIV